MNIIEFLFTYSGARLYMEWLLPTNPKSKNLLIRRWACSSHWTFGALQSVHSGKDAHRRLRGAYFWAVLHIVLGILMQLYVPHMWLLNLYINIYPIIVQIYVGYRCSIRIRKGRQL